jgi:hypothetical protein
MAFAFVAVDPIELELVLLFGADEPVDRTDRSSSRCFRTESQKRYLVYTP